MRRRRGLPMRDHEGGADDDEEEPRPVDGGPPARSRKEERAKAYEAKIAARREAKRVAEEALLRDAQERQAREQEESEEWMKSFAVEGAGEEARTQEQEEQLMNDIVDLIKTRRTVALEDIETQFGLRSSEVVERVRSLEGEGRIVGIMDDRGKFISVSEQDMRDIARVIQERGRMSVTELATECSSILAGTATGNA
jgi:hypothetical protein